MTVQTTHAVSLISPQFGKSRTATRFALGQRTRAGPSSIVAPSSRQGRQGHKIGAPEEVAWRMGYLTDQELLDRARPLRRSGYGEYLISLVEEAQSRP